MYYKITCYMASDVAKHHTEIPENSECQKIVSDIAASSKPKHFCQACSITFTRNTHLKRHLKTQHGQVFTELAPSRGSQCSLWCPLCGERFSSRAHTENHIAAFHQIEIQQETLTFHTEEEFAEWKITVEEAEQCTFVSTKGESRLSNGMYAKYYHCHRCGKYQSTVTGERKRRLKLSGTIKTGAYCPARIKRFTTIIDAAVEIIVEYVPTHIGHGKDVESASIRRRSQQQRKQEDSSKDRVLKNLQSNINQTKRVKKLPRRELITEPPVPFKENESEVQDTSDVIPVAIHRAAFTETEDSVIFLYQPPCESINNLDEYQEQVRPQEIVVVNSEHEKLSTEDRLARRKEHFMSLLQVAASKIDSANSEHHFDVLDRYALAIISHLDSFVAHGQVQDHTVQDSVTYQVLSAHQPM